ncbi:polysaccharide pyruvyl transferase family protein [Clostridium algoriphilum]|uniref:polysaccharide pyruvyl transferase family protein n=1 Tax=Clostridium algoriphilum TaxID=198347 RepID=UPI001CF1E012|nr:polysaccharide pyruvyl transferase family protein [Clostridium algoriphilum]MCB2293960.1 polysaccharide pyruvyl transferase family protein [Clostridium algoriphilum]
MKKKKIAILTINDYKNYGNRLQNYASQEVLKSLGFSVETLVNNTKHTGATQEDIGAVGRIKRLMGLGIKGLFTRVKFIIWKNINKNKIHTNITKRVERFKNFTKVNISETDYSISDNNIPKDLSSRFDYFVTGSDQVWNPNFRYGSGIDFLTFASPSKRITYSPSFGIAEIPQYYKKSYKAWLSQMSCLSVREEAGADIIKELTGREASVLIDPTLMLSKEKWIAISDKAVSKPEKKYLLTYFMERISEVNMKRIRTIAKDNELQIVNLADITDGETYKVSPSEYIDYINSASIFCTDSFHGVIFSVLMGTPFMVFDREGAMPSMNSRIDTLLSTLNLESRLAKNISTKEQIFEADYTHVSKILEVERKKAMDYLKEALNVKDVA